MKTKPIKRYSRDLNQDEMKEFWDSLLKEGKSMTFYARKYKTSTSAINRAYNKMREKSRRK